MSQSLRHEFHNDLASSIVHDIQYLHTQYYYFIGKVQSWGVSDIAPENIQTDSAIENFIVRSNALYFKKITQNDVSMVCKRYNWTTSTVFAQWDHTIDMSDEMFYCVTDQNHVFKCLNNNNGGLSTVKPTELSYTHFKTSDGYTWKYMYTIPDFKVSKFMTDDYIPIQKALSDSFYNKGSIDGIVILNGGTGYTDDNLTFITVENTSVGSGATVTLSVNTSTGAITGVTVTDGGSGYSYGAKINIITSTGSNAVLTPVITAGVITSVTVTDGGVGYSTTDTAVVYTHGAVLKPVVNRTTGSIEDVIIINSGIGYATVPDLTVAVDGAETPGTGLYTGNSTALLEAVIDNGEIVRVLIRDPGIDYPTDNSTNIVITGDGSNAVCTPVIDNGSIIGVIVENAGTGYTYIDVSVTGSGTSASLRGIIASSDYQSNQSIIEQVANPGGVYSVKIIDSGSNYSTNSTVSIVGDGSGATADLVLDSGAITNIIITNPGSNYTYANVVINDPLRELAPEGSQDFSGYTILPPTGGHGSNAIDELNGNVLAINSIIKKENGLTEVTLPQEYRQYGIIKSPVYYASGKSFKLDSDLVAYNVSMAATTGMVEDEILIQNNVKFRVVSFDSSSAVLQKLGGVNIDLNTLTSEDNLRNYTVTGISRVPLLDKYSGRMLYLSNEDPFVIEDEQSISIKTFIKM